MRQFDVCAPTFRTPPDAPYLIVLQSDLLSGLRTTIAAPLRRRHPKENFTRLTPRVQVEGEEFLLSVTEVAYVPVQSLGRVAANLSADRERIIAALDMLFTGI